LQAEQQACAGHRTPRRLIELRALVHVTTTAAAAGRPDSIEAVSRLAGVPLRVVRLGDGPGEAAILSELAATGNEDVVTILMARAIAREARAVGAEVVFTGDTATRLAAKSIALTAKGRGSRVATDVCLCDSASWRGTVTLVRPFRDMLHEEITDYASLLVAPDSPAPPAQSALQTIDTASASWVDLMQAKYDQTVFTILGSTARLTPEPGAPQCEFCRCFMALAERDPAAPSLCYGCRVLFAGCHTPVAQLLHDLQGQQQ
jgi:hypothetical protein